IVSAGKNSLLSATATATGRNVIVGAFDGGSGQYINGNFTSTSPIIQTGQNYLPSTVPVNSAITRTANQVEDATPSALFNSCWFTTVLICNVSRTRTFVIPAGTDTYWIWASMKSRYRPVSSVSPASGGSVSFQSGPAGDGLYASGTNVTVTAKANPGY